MDGIPWSQPPGQNRVTYEARSWDCRRLPTPHCALKPGCSDAPITGTILVCLVNYRAVLSGSVISATQETMNKKIIWRTIFSYHIQK